MTESAFHRRLHALTCLGAAAHHIFELGAGVGLVFQPWLGLRGSGAFWAADFSAWLAATRGSRVWDRPLAFAAGMSVGAVALHYLMWPWELRVGLPYLVRAEGLRSELLPAYNGVLWSWGAAALGALVRETPRSALPLAAAGFALALTLRGSANRHFRWIGEQAFSNPAWWNRALARKEQ